MPVHPNSLANLKPSKPGEARNPKGKNQYDTSYRRDFELAIDDLLSGVYDFRRELVGSDETGEALCLLCNIGQCDTYVGHSLYAHGACIDQIDHLTRGQVIALVTVQRAMQGDEKMLPVVLDRLWPKTTKIELPPVEPRSQTFVPTEADQLALSQEFKGNGEDKSGVLQ